ncbi:MAG: SPOR domain-containing protein [Gemmobacter sp.]
MAGQAAFRTMLGAALVLGLAGCEDGAQPFGFLGGDRAAGENGTSAATTTRLVERDVEAPGVFEVSEPGLWDGRPSLGGVWVAHPEVSDPERVIIRNPANGKFVIGALFRRERDHPGPRLQVSSDAASTIEMLAGQPTTLHVVALRREEVPVAEPEAPILDAAETIETESLDAVTETAAAAIDRAEGQTASAPSAATAPAARPAAAPAAPPAAPTGTAATGRNFLQIGIFSVEANARRAADQMRAAGATPDIRRGETQGRAFWRVVVGPAETPAERSALLETVKGLGYADAYYVSR